MTQPRIAIIGAGISGLTLAHALTPHAEITLFEKSRGVGGRMATRRAGPFEFDHGTQFFTVKDREFQSWLEPLINRGLIAEWQGNVIFIDASDPAKPPQYRPWPEPHYVAVPNMKSLAKHLSQNLDIVLNTQVARLPALPPGDLLECWSLFDEEGNALGRFDWVISTAPPAQTISLFVDRLPAISQLAQATMQGCYTLMLGFDHCVGQPTFSSAAIAARIRNNPIEWIAINSTKPGRDQAYITLVAHSSNAWAQDHIDDDQGQIQAFLLCELAKLIEPKGLLSALTDIDISQASHTAMHRWRYALKLSPGGSQSSPNPYLDPSLKLASTGDWSSASRIEDVWLSAHALAAKLHLYL